MCCVPAYVPQVVIVCLVQVRQAAKTVHQADLEETVPSVICVLGHAILAHSVEHGRFRPNAQANALLESTRGQDQLRVVRAPLENILPEALLNVKFVQQESTPFL